MTVSAAPSPRRRIAEPVLDAALGVLARWWFPMLLIVLWELALRAGLLDHSFFPAPSSLVVIAWGDLVSGRLLVDTVASVQRLAAGMALGILIGVSLGLAMALWRPVDLMFGSLVQVLRAIPPITWIGFSILWFGLGSKPAIFLITLGVVFPILLNTYAGVKQVDQIYLRAAHNLGARGWMLFKGVILAAALPSILTGIRVAMGLGWILVVVSELIAVPSGLGNTLMRAQDYGLVDRMLAYMLVIGLYGYLSDLLIVRASRYLLRWQRNIETA